ncbi:MAG TPA: DUF1398 family protein [Rhabdochlamydiaceae bacterium]
MNFEVAKECTHLSDEEKITFPEVVRRLHEAGIESYYADLLSSTRTFYAKSIAHTVNSLENHDNKAADAFNAEEVVNAIRHIQAGKIQYREFVKKIMDAGVISYMVFIDGHKAIYFGRRGDFHIEEFRK